MMVNEHCLRKNSVSRVIDVSVVEAADDPFLGCRLQGSSPSRVPLKSSPKSITQKCQGPLVTIRH